MTHTTVFARLRRPLAPLLFVTAFCAASGAADSPKFVEKDGRWALLVDGQQVEWALEAKCYNETNGVGVEQSLG